MLQFFRALSLVLLVAVSVIDTRKFHFVLSKEWQYIIATSILITLLFVDVITAFIFALVLATVYVKLYDLKIPMISKEKDVYDDSLLDFITPEDLKSAQNNVVDETANKKEYKGIEGVYGEAVYGAQGLDDTFPGFSKLASYDALS